MSARKAKNKMSLTERVEAAERRRGVYRRLMMEAARKRDKAEKRCLAAEKIMQAVMHKCGVERIELTGEDIRDAPEYVGQYGVGKTEDGEQVAFYRYVRADLVNTVTIEEEGKAGQDAADAGLEKMPDPVQAPAG